MIAGWRGKLLSYAVKITLFKACLASIPIYLLSFFKFPKWVVDRDGNGEELSAFSAETCKWRGIQKRKWKRAKQKRKWNFLRGNRNKNGTVISGGTNTKMKLSVFVNMEFFISTMGLCLLCSPSIKHDTITQMSIMAHVWPSFHYHAMKLVMILTAMEAGHKIPFHRLDVTLCLTCNRAAWYTLFDYIGSLSFW